VSRGIRLRLARDKFRKCRFVLVLSARPFLVQMEFGQFKSAIKYHKTDKAAELRSAVKLKFTFKLPNFLPRPPRGTCRRGVRISRDSNREARDASNATHRSREESTSSASSLGAPHLSFLHHVRPPLPPPLPLPQPCALRPRPRFSLLFSPAAARGDAAVGRGREDVALGDSKRSARGGDI